MKGGRKKLLKTTGHPANIQTGHLSNGEVQSITATPSCSADCWNLNKNSSRKKQVKLVSYDHNRTDHIRNQPLRVE